MSRLRTLKFLLFAVMAADMARAEQCPPAQPVTSVDMQVADDGRIYVPVIVRNVKKSLLLDTGGIWSALTRQTVDKLGLRTRRSQDTLVGAGGDTVNLTTSTSILLGNLRIHAADFLVIPDASGFAADVPNVAGLLAPNLYHHYDVDIDFSTMKFSLYSRQHCDGRAVRWPGGMAVLPVRIDTSDHIQIPVQLDGHHLTATLDTGATRSVLDVTLAKTVFGLTPGDSNTPEVGRLIRSPKSKTYAHRFKSLVLGGIATADPEVRLIPDLTHSPIRAPRSDRGSRLSPATGKPGFGDLILGMNVIREWHLYIAYGEQKLYLARSPVSVSVKSASPTNQAAAIRRQPTVDPPPSSNLRPH